MTTARPRNWLYIPAAWALVLLFNVEQSYVAQAVSAAKPLAWSTIFVLIAPGIVLWACLTPLVIRLLDRFPLDRKGIPVHIVAALTGGALDATLYHIIDPWVNPNGTRPWIAGFFRYLQINTIYYFGVVAITLVVRYSALLRERSVAAAQLTAQLTTAHLRSLQAQLRPHFLFNTLNTIAELVHRDPEAADKMIGRLGGLLRRSFDSLGDHEVSLASELAFLRDYSEIIAVRFRGRIAITTAIAPDAMGASVPSLILQPLVENAVRHGLEPRAKGGTVEIVARRTLDLLDLEVRDDGAGLPADGAVRYGIGLNNTADRLQHLYGAAHRFSVSQRAGGGTVVAIQIPFRPADVSSSSAEAPHRSAREVA